MKRRSKSATSPAPRAAPDLSLVAILSPTGTGESIESCKVLCVRIGANSREVISHASFRGPASLTEATDWIANSNASATIITLPGSDVICRTMAMPAGSREQLEMALRLQVENLLLGGSARWRTDGAVLPATNPEGPRTALVVEWPNSNKPDAALDEFIKSNTTGFAPPIAALVSLTTGALAQGSRESLGVFLERKHGSISIAYSDGIRCAYRIVREDGSDTAGWRSAIIRATTETLILSEFPDATIKEVTQALEGALDQCDDGLIAPMGGGFESFQALLPGTPRDSDWWVHNGVLAGTALAIRTGLDRLCNLQSAEKISRPGFFPHMIQLAGTRKFATRLAVAAVALLALFPPAAAGARLLYLMWLLPEPDAFARVLDRTDQQYAMYRDYEKYAWPMAKLLGDIASTTPEGIELETVAIAQGGQVSINGNAKPRGDGSSASEAILLMEFQMRESGVFDRVEKSWDAPNANGVIKFDLSAAIVKPSLVPNYPAAQDFAKLTLRDRKYGPADPDAVAPVGNGAIEPDASQEPSVNASSTGSAGTDVANAPIVRQPIAPPSPAGGDPAPTATADGASGDAATTTDPRGGRRTTRSASANAPDIARRSSGGAAQAAPVVPDPLTDEQIAAMTQAEAREAAGRVSTARGLSGIDEATEQRLKAEFYKLLARARKP